MRFDGLAEAGIFGVDDGRYVLDGLAKANEIRFGWDLVQAKRAEMDGGPGLHLAETVPAAVNGLADPHPFAPKHGYAYAIGAVLLKDFSVSAGNYVEAFFGTLLILITFGFVRTVHNSTSASVAAAFVALSAYCVYFSRNTYPQCISGCFFVLAVWIHAMWLRRSGGLHWLVAVGVLAGISFWTNYQVAGALPVIAIIHAVVCVRLPHGIRTFVLGGVAIAVGFGGLLIAAEAISYPMIMLFRSQGLTYPQATFFELLWPRLTGQTAAPFNPTGLALFPYFFGRFHGWTGAIAIALVCAAGTVGAATRKTVHENEVQHHAVIWLYFGLAFAVPFLLFSLKTMQGARMFTYALPFFAALFGVATSYAWTADAAPKTLRRAAVGLMLLVAFGSNAITLREVRAVRSAFPDAIAFVKQHEDTGLCAAWSSSVRCYALDANIDGGDVYRYLGNGEAPPRWFANDWQELYDRRYPDEPIALAPDAVPAQTLHHEFDRIFIETEALPSYGNTIENLRWVRSLDRDRVRQLLIYDLKITPLRSRESRSN